MATSQQRNVMGLEQDLMDRMTDELAREIDKTLLDDLMVAVLKDEGWIEIKVAPTLSTTMISSKTTEWYIQTAEWIHINAQGDYRLLRGQWLFKDPRDATAFLLRWA